MTAEPFRELVHTHVSRWRIEHPGEERDRDENGYFHGLRSGAPIPALVWLSVTASHIADPDGKWVPKLIVPVGRLEGILTGKHVVIEFRVAEAISIALDAPYATAGIEVMPNPLAKKELRDACCGEQDYEDDWPAQPLPIAI